MTSFHERLVVPLDVIEECNHVEESINLNEMPLFGRFDQVQILREGFHRACHGRSQLILVHGPVGVGKTKLVKDSLQNYVTSNAKEANRGFFVSGNFEQLPTCPFPAFVVALTELVGCILASENKEKARYEFNQCFSDVEVDEIIKFIPDLASIAWNNKDTAVERQHEPQASIDCTSLQLGYAPIVLLFVSLIKLLVECSPPVVLFLDDVQFIDDDSLRLLNALIADDSFTSLLIVCASHELQPSAINCGDAALLISNMFIRDLTVPDINDLFSRALPIEDPSSLIEVLVTIASTNIFHLNEFVQMLQMEGFLHDTGGNWAYSLDKIKQFTTESWSLEKILDFKMQRLGMKVNNVMKVASYLGQLFHFDTLVYVCRALNRETWDDTVRSVNEALLVVVRLGYLTESDRRYSFVHDCYRLQWVKMMEEEFDQYAVRLQIGMAIRSHMLIEQDSSLLFPAANNVLLGLHHAGNKAVVKHAVDLLYEASRKAFVYRIFLQAKSYALAAIRLLKEDVNHWVHQYRMSVNLYCILASIEIMLGCFEEAHNAAHEFLSHNDCFDDSIKARILVIHCLAKGGKYDMAKRHGYNGLRDLGRPLSRSNLLVHLVREDAHVKSLLKGMHVEDLASLRLMKGSRRLATMRILRSLILPTYLSIKGKPDGIRFCLVVLRMVTLSLTHGVCEDSCLGFACYGMYLCRRGNGSDGARFGQVALLLVNRFVAKDLEASVMFIVHSFVLHYQQPWLGFRDLIKHEVLPQELQRGNLDSASELACLLIQSATFSDSPLSLTEKEIAQYFKVIKVFDGAAMYNLAAFLWQRTQNLMGLANDPVTLTGAVMDEDAVISIMEKNCQSTALEGLYLCKLMLALFFESWTVVDTLIPHVDRNARSLRGHLSQYLCYFTVAAASSALYRVSHRRKHLRYSVKAMKRLSMWKADGVEICAPMVTFMEAEWALTHELWTAPQLFLSAAQGFASMKSFANYQGLAYERIGLYFRNCGKVQSSSHYYTIAMSVYENWEAFAKVKDLQLTLSSMITPPSEVSTVSTSWEGNRSSRKNGSCRRSLKRLSRQIDSKRRYLWSQ